MKDILTEIQRAFTKRPLQTTRFVLYVSGALIPDYCCIYCNEDLTCNVTDIEGHIEANVPFPAKTPIPFQYKMITNISGTSKIYLCY